MTERASAANDAGVTLVEVILYVLLSSLVLIATTMILINSLTTQRDVASVSEATSRGQGIGSAIERALHNGLAFDVSAHGTHGTQLRVRTSLEGSQACQGFLLTDGQARLSQSATAIPLDATTWSDWESGIAPDGTEPYFTATGPSVSYSFTITTDSAPVRIRGQAALRSAPTGVTAPCW